MVSEDPNYVRPTEESRRVAADHVVAALTGVELEREAARVADRVGAAELAGHLREARKHRRAVLGLRTQRRALRQRMDRSSRSAGMDPIAVKRTTRLAAAGR